jgi:CRP-like cAMP-binding protein
MNNYGAEKSYSKNGAVVNLNAKPVFRGGDALKETSSGRWNQFSGETFPTKALLANRLLAAQTGEEFERLLLQLQPVLVTSGEVVYQPDGASEYVYFPETAVFSQLSILEDGKTVETAMIGSEGIVGLASVLGIQTGNVWTQTLIAGSAYRMSAKIFKQEFFRGGFLQTSCLDYTNSYIRQIMQRAVCNNHHRIENRFSSWLLMLADRTKKNNLRLTQEQIAVVLGVQRPSVTCIAQNLRSNECIDYLRGRIVLNRQKLEASACECYAAVK